jgi:hypothetical protein
MADLTDFMHGYRVRAFQNLDPPMMATPVIEGTQGTTSYTYCASFTTINGETTQSDSVVVATGNATLAPTARVLLSVASVPPAVTAINYFKLVGSTYRLIGTGTPTVPYVYDQGQATTATTPSLTNTSGRPEYLALGYHINEYRQRQEGIDEQALKFTADKKLWDTIFNDGDIVDGLGCSNTSGNTWAFNDGKIYLYGRIIDISGANVTITGTGNERVGVVPSADWVTPNEDSTLRAHADEGTPAIYGLQGADRLTVTFTWGVDQVGQVDIQEFVDGAKKLLTLPIERSELDKKLAQRTYDVSGNFSVQNFPLSAVEHPTDTTKIGIKVDGGSAYPNGFYVEIPASRTVWLNKATDYANVNESRLDPFIYTGGMNGWNSWSASAVIGSDAIYLPTTVGNHRYKCTARTGDYKTGTAEPTWPVTPGETVNDNNVTWTCLGDDFDLSGLTLLVTVGSGSEHTVTFGSNNMTAAQVAAAIEAALNAVPTSGNLCDAQTGTALVKLYAIDGKSLTLNASSTALAELGWVSGTTTARGQRIYPCGNTYIKDVSDLSYLYETVITLTRSSVNAYDLVTDLYSIVGISNSLTDCHDSVFNYTVNTDYIKGTTVYPQSINWAPGGIEPTAGHTYYAKVKKAYLPTKGVRQLCKVINSTVVKGAAGATDTLTLGGSPTITRIYNDTTTTISGTPKDVVRILAVKDSNGDLIDDYSGQYTLRKNSDSLQHATSQLSWASATTQPNVGATYYVDYEIWKHTTEGDYVSADSYDMYSYIEGDSTSGINLRDCVDFRTTSGVLPYPGEDCSLDYNYYLYRVDKLAIDDFGNITTITGTPSLVPVVPMDQTSLMTLAIIRLQPYTYSAASVVIEPLETLRLTQKGIKDLQTQLDWMRYYLVKNSQEQQVANSSAASTGTVGGIFSDAVTGFGNIDVTFNKNGISQTAAVDIQSREIRLKATRTRKTLSLPSDLAGSTNVHRRGNNIVLDFTSSIMMEQPKAGVFVNCAVDFTYDSYYGQVQLTPSLDSFTDHTQAPAVNIKDEDNNFKEAVQALSAQLFHDIDWGNWRTTSGKGVSRESIIAASSAPYGSAAYESVPVWHTAYNDGVGWWNVESTSQLAGTNWNSADTMRRGYLDYHAIATGTQERSGVRTALIPGTITRDLGNLVVDMSVVPYMRTKDDAGNPFQVAVFVTGLMPNADHAITVGGIATNFVYNSSPSNHAGTIGTNTYQGYSTVRSSNNGILTGYFNMPSGVKAGSANVKVFLYNAPASSQGSATFSSQGYNVKQQQTTIGVPTMKLDRETKTETRELVSINTVYVDPLAQSFLIPSTGPSYRYICAAGLYFKSKPTTNDKPITVQIRNMVNGVPGTTTLASKVLLPSDVNVSDNSSAETMVYFADILGYTAGTSYCLVVAPGKDNTDYNIWMSQLGVNDILTQEIISTQPNWGVAFHSPNNESWSEWTLRDFKFKIYEATFKTSGEILWNNIDTSPAQNSMFVLGAEEFSGPGTNAAWYYSNDDGTSWKGFNQNLDVDTLALWTGLRYKTVITGTGAPYQVGESSGTLLFYNDASSNHIMPNYNFPDDLNYPNSITLSADIAASGTNGATGTSVTPYISIDDGDTWVEVEPEVGYTPTYSSGSFYKNEFKTPGEVTITDATNTTPIVIASAQARYHDNAVVLIAGVGGNTNANGVRRLKNCTANTAQLVDPVTGNDIAGNAAYTDTGTMRMNQWSQIRGYWKLDTTDRISTPKLTNLGSVCIREEV